MCRATNWPWGKPHPQQISELEWYEDQVWSIVKRRPTKRPSPDDSPTPPSASPRSTTNDSSDRLSWYCCHCEFANTDSTHLTCSLCQADRTPWGEPNSQQITDLEWYEDQVWSVIKQRPTKEIQVWNKGNQISTLEVIQNGPSFPYFLCPFCINYC